MPKTRDYKPGDIVRVVNHSDDFNIGWDGVTYPLPKEKPAFVPIDAVINAFGDPAALDTGTVGSQAHTTSTELTRISPRYGGHQFYHPELPKVHVHNLEGEELDIPMTRSATEALQGPVATTDSSVLQSRIAQLEAEKQALTNQLSAPMPEVEDADEDSSDYSLLPEDDDTLPEGAEEDA